MVDRGILPVMERRRRYLLFKINKYTLGVELGRPWQYRIRNTIHLTKLIPLTVGLSCL
jgi:hypothetical protein